MCTARPALYRGIRQWDDTRLEPAGGGRMKWPTRHRPETNGIPVPTEGPAFGPVRLGMLALGVIAVVALATVTALTSVSDAQSLVTTTSSLRPDQRGVGEDGRDREATDQPRRQPAERQPHDRHPTRRRRTGQGNLDRRGTDQRQRSGAPAGGARPAHDDEQRQYRDLQPAAAEGGRRGTGDRRPRGPDGADQRRRQ